MHCFDTRQPEARTVRRHAGAVRVTSQPYERRSAVTVNEKQLGKPQQHSLTHLPPITDSLPLLLAGCRPTGRNTPGPATPAFRSAEPRQCQLAKGTDGWVGGASVPGSSR